MFCTKCGKEISKDAMFCQNCGSPVQKAAESAPAPVIKTDKTEFTVATEEKTKKKIKLLVFIVATVVVLLVAIVIVVFGGNNTNNIEEPDESIFDIEEDYMETGKDSEKNDSDNPILFDNPELLPTEISYNFIDYNDFSQYWFDGTFRCGTDFEEGDYYILPLFGAGAIYEVVDSPNDFSWTYNRILRKVSVKNGQYVKVSHGGIMVPADEVDTNNWSKYGVFLVGKDIPAGDYKMETISKEYDTALYAISGIDGAYQVCEGSVEKEPIDSDYLFESQEYITLENGQYIIITNIKLTNVSVKTSSIIESTAADEEFDIENDIAFVKEVFSKVNFETVIEEYNAKIVDNETVQINGSFANVDGIYEIEFYGENNDGFEPSNMYAIRFIWDYNQEVAIKEIVDAMCNYLGTYEDNYDHEWSYYCWFGMEKTRFSNKSVSNCFDTQIFGSDGYIKFGMYTISN